MEKIAYVDHSYHKKTLSTDFLPEILRNYGHVVDYFWDDSWAGGDAIKWDAVSEYDVVIMFQAYCQIGGGYYRNLHPNVVFIPMLDQFGIWQGPLFNLTRFWEPFQGSKVLNFSNALHAMTTGFGIKSHFVRYYQSVKKSPPRVSTGLRGFFWLRRESELPWSLIRSLIADTEFESFHIHLANDPGSPKPCLPHADDLKRFNVTTSTWFESRSEFEAILDKANVYFAPRMEEGIGQSFLEAFARGQCVVAPNEGTMNEYILHGINGLLYDWKNPTPLDFTSALDCGARAREAAKHGRKVWEDAEERLVEFIITPSETLYSNKYNHSFDGFFKKCSLREYLSEISKNYAILRKTRFIWHPLKRLIGKFYS